MQIVKIDTYRFISKYNERDFIRDLSRQPICVAVACCKELCKYTGVRFIKFKFVINLINFILFYNK